jgi:hypothetical protein
MYVRVCLYIFTYGLCYVRICVFIYVIIYYICIYVAVAVATIGWDSYGCGYMYCKSTYVHTYGISWDELAEVREVINRRFCVKR